MAFRLTTALRLAATGALVIGVANAQPLNRGRALSIDFLQWLTRPAPDSSEIAVIHAEVGSVMIVSRDARRHEVVYLRGSTFLWAQITEQLAAASARGEPLHLEVSRWVIDGESCPSLNDKIAAFLARLDETTSDLRGASVKKEEIVVDAPAFLIQMAAKDASITVTPNGASEPPLQRAAYELHGVVSRCAGSQDPKIEHHDF